MYSKNASLAEFFLHEPEMLLKKNCFTPSFYRFFSYSPPLFILMPTVQLSPLDLIIFLNADHPTLYFITEHIYTIYYM